MNLAQIERSLRQCLEESEVESRQQIASGLDESVWRDSPPALLPYQQRWVADESPIKVIEKSRRVGLSWSEACASVLEAAKQNGRSTIYCSYNFDMTENFIKDCAFWAKHFQLAASAIEEVMLNNGDDDILTYQIRFASGYTIKALSGKPNNIRGKQARVVIDEAAFCQDLSELIKSAIALLMWGGQIRILSTHNGETNTFNQLVQQIEAKELDYSLHRVTLDDALEDGLYKRICLIQGIEWTLEGEFAWRSQLIKDYGRAADEELFCKPTGATDCLFNSAAVDERAIGQWEAPQFGHYYLLCIDPNFGGTDYWSTLVLDLSVFPYALVAEYREQNKSTSYSRDRTLALMDAYNPVITAIESNSGGTVIAERLVELRPSMRIELVKTSETSKRINTDRVALAIDQGDLIYPPDWAGLGEMKRFGALSRKALSGNDDTVMALAAGWVWIEEARSLFSVSYSAAGVSSNPAWKVAQSL